MPDERPLVIVIDPRTLDAALEIAGMLLLFAMLCVGMFFGCAWAGV